MTLPCSCLRVAGATRQQREVHRCAMPWPRLGPHAAAVRLDDAPRDRQAYAVAGIRVASVQSLEHDENPFAVTRLEAYPVIGHRKHPLQIVACGVDVNLGALPAAKL